MENQAWYPLLLMPIKNNKIKKGGILMYSPEVSNDALFGIIYDTRDIVILILAILAIVGFIFYKKRNKR